MSERISRLSLHIAGAAQGETTVSRDGGRELWNFTYQPQASRDAALTMPRNQPSYGWDGILPAFEQHLPEMDVGLFPAAIWKLVVRDHPGLLWVAGQRRLGRLRFTRPGEPLPQIASLGLTRADIAATRDGDALLADLLSRLTSLPGVSGVQPKLLLPLPGGNDPLRALADTHLLKGNRPEYPYATTVEAATLELAEACGLDVPTRILSADGRLLAIERFDLDAAGEPIGFDEACSLMGLWARDKYTRSCEALHKALMPFLPALERHAATLELFRRFAFNLIVENGDAHLKNFGLLYETEDKVRLAPAYDLLTTTCFEGLVHDMPALPLGGRKVWDDWRGFAAVAQSCGLKPGEVRSLLLGLLEALRGHRSLPARYAERVPAAAGILSRVSEAWDRGVARLESHLAADSAP